jgi:cupin 2 domain-containing protein
MNNLLSDIPANLDEEFFETLLSAEGTRIERIVSRGHCSPAEGWYDQAHGEFVVLLKGGARLEFDDGQVVSLAAGDWLNIPAHRRHRVAWTDGNQETVWLAVHYP